LTTEKGTTGRHGDAGTAAHEAQRVIYLSSSRWPLAPATASQGRLGTTAAKVGGALLAAGGGAIAGSVSRTHAGLGCPTSASKPARTTVQVPGCPTLHCGQ
jgi:hypothetical protein